MTKTDNTSKPSTTNTATTARVEKTTAADRINPEKTTSGSGTTAARKPTTTASTKIAASTGPRKVASTNSGGSSGSNGGSGSSGSGSTQRKTTQTPDKTSAPESRMRAGLQVGGEAPKRYSDVGNDPEGWVKFADMMAFLDQNKRQDTPGMRGRGLPEERSWNPLDPESPVGEFFTRPWDVMLGGTRPEEADRKPWNPLDPKSPVGEFFSRPWDMIYGGDVPANKITLPPDVFDALQAPYLRRKQADSPAWNSDFNNIDWTAYKRFATPVLPPGAQDVAPERASQVGPLRAAGIDALLASQIGPSGIVQGVEVGDDITGGIPKADGYPGTSLNPRPLADLQPAMQVAPPEIAAAAGLTPTDPDTWQPMARDWGSYIPLLNGLQDMSTGGAPLTKEDYIRMGIDPEAADAMPGIMTNAEDYVPGPVPDGPGSGGDNVLGDIKTGIDGVMDGSNKPKLDFTLGWGHGNPVNIDDWSRDGGSSGDVNYHPPGTVPPGVLPFPDVNHNGIDDRLEGIGLGAFAPNRSAVFPTMPPYKPGIDNEWTYFRPGMAQGGIVGYAEGGAVSPLAQQDPRVEIIAAAEDALHNAIEGTPEPDDQQDIGKFVETFGKDALEKLQANVAAGMKMRQKGGRPVQGPGGPTDDAVPAVVDGEQPVALSNGEFVMSADAVDGAGGPEAMQQLHDKLAGMKKAA